MINATIEKYINEETGEEEQRIIPPALPGEPGSAGARILTIADIEAIEDVLEATLYIPEWQASVKVRQFTKAEEFALRQEARGQDGKVDPERLEMLFVTHGVIEPRMTEEHIGMLLTKSQSAIDRILKKVTALNGATEEAAAAAERRFSDG